MHGACACTLQHLEADGAEQEDGVEQDEAESQPAVQLPAVQVDTHDLKVQRELRLFCTHLNIIQFEKRDED